MNFCKPKMSFCKDRMNFYIPKGSFYKAQTPAGVNTLPGFRDLLVRSFNKFLYGNFARLGFDFHKIITARQIAYRTYYRATVFSRMLQNSSVKVVKPDIANNFIRLQGYFILCRVWKRYSPACMVISCEVEVTLNVLPV